VSGPAPTPEAFVQACATLSPGQILAKMQKLGISPPSSAAMTAGIDAADAIAAAKWQTELASDANAGQNRARNATKIAGAALVATGVLAPFGLLMEAYSLIPNSFFQALTQSGLNLSGPQIMCSRAAEASPYPLLTPGQLYSSPIAPRSLASVLIPVLCQGFFDVEQCRQLDPGALGWAAAASNLTIASIASLWNAKAAGYMVDYFVPYVPSGTDIAHGFGVWAGKGLRHAGWSPWLAPPPFVIPGQAQYAFWPLASVPASVADPSTEFRTSDGSPGSAPAGYPWSRITARAGPLPTATQRTVSTVAKVAVGAGLAAAIGPALLKWATGKSAEVLLEQALAAIADL